MSTKLHYLLLGITVILCPVREEPAKRLLHSLHCSLQYFQDSKKAFMVLKGILSSSQEKNYLQMMLMFIIMPWFHWTFWKVWNPMAQAWVVRCHSQGWVQDVWKKEAEKKRKTFALHKGALFLHKGPVRGVSAHILWVKIWGEGNTAHAMEGSDMGCWSCPVSLHYPLC